MPRRALSIAYTVWHNGRMKIGYARTSTEDQNLALQIDALTAAGCEKIYREQKSGASRARPQLTRLLNALNAGDELIVWKLDRLGRSVSHLVLIVDRIREAGAGFRSITESMDTTTPAGKMLFHLFATLAEFERAMIIERTHAGLAAARRRGVKLGRRHKLDLYQVRRVQERLEEGELLANIASDLRVDPSTLWRNLKRLTKAA